MEDGLFTDYDRKLIVIWSMYYYYKKRLSLLPKAKDGHLDYGLVRSMMALDAYKYDGDAYKKQRGIPTGSSDEGTVEF